MVNSTIKILLNLGVHIGNHKFFLIEFYKKFLLGFKYNYCIFNINYLVFFLRKSFSFFFSLGKENSKFLFYYHKLFHTNIWFFQSFFHSQLIKSDNFFFDCWYSGLISNLYTSCYLVIRDLYNIFDISKSEKGRVLFHTLDMKKFFLRVLSFTYGERSSQIHWDYNKYRRYWRFYLFFKFYRNLNRFPDAFLYFTPINYKTPVLETKVLRIPVVSVLDTSYDFYNYVTFPLLGNISSPFTGLFFFNILLNAYNKGKALSLSSWAKTTY